jgi:polysaccharide pyruvyl transferase WcaK-like protein
MIVEIHGAGFQNKGAELMLRTTIAELRERLPGFEPALDPSYGRYDQRSRLRTWQMFPVRSHVGSYRFLRGFRWQRMMAPLRGRWLDMYGCVTLSSVQALIDISGFAYSDQWGIRPTRNFAMLARYYKSRDKPVILLPQALGPFERAESRSAFAQVLEHADLVFARDRRSYEIALDLAPTPDRVRRAPDITLFYPDRLDVVERRTPGYVCVVPNARLLAQGREQWGDTYQAYLVRVVKELIQRNVPVKILVHDMSGPDLAIAHQVQQEAMSADVQLVEEQDPMVLKEIIGASLFLIGSRYHSLVAAFARSVPAIGMGWAHKYRMLLEDFDCGRFMVGHDSPIEVLLGHVDQLLDPTINGDYRARISARLGDMSAANRRMWQLVVDLLSDQAPTPASRS